MCGICGKFIFNNRPVEERLIRKMCRTMVHRGPDDEGIHVGPHIGLGQRRLSIIDLSKTACPPLSNENGTVWLVFNGEIYNFIELKSQLLTKGHVFKSSTDTEVIIHLYEEYGPECLKHLRGMFSFALWDVNQQRIFAARDRLGKKPFIYAKTTGALVFGSEIKAVTADPEISIEPDFQAIDQYLTHQYVPSPQTAFCGINKLPPAHFLLCNASGDLTVSRYWSPSSPGPLEMDENELQVEIIERLKESVRMRLMADVPLGAFLSGGIDSGTIVALMAMCSSDRIKTFSIGFEDNDFNELPYARMVAERYQTEHHEFIVKPSATEIMPDLVRHYNEPFADSSALPTYFVSKTTREFVTVALSGDGGDENFAGYNHYDQVLMWEKYDILPKSIRQAVTHGITSLLNGHGKNNYIARVLRAMTLVGADLPDRQHLQRSIFKPQEKDNCYSDHFKSLLAPSSQPLELEWEAAMDSLAWLMRYDQSHYLPDCLMVKTDRASMANSLEVRCPFLDHEFIEFTAGIPSSLKRSQGVGKLILKKAVQSLLPDQVINRPKSGFGIPLAKWFSNDLSGLLKAMLTDDTAVKRGLFNQAFVSKMITEQKNGIRDWHNRLWALLMLEMWFREFVD